jgi:hypothetical protein
VKGKEKRGRGLYFGNVPLPRGGIPADVILRGKISKGEEKKMETVEKNEERGKKRRKG